MSKTKFTKVAVSERLPKDFSKILINYKGSDDLQMYDYFDNLHEQDFFEENINFWFEESPDREEEMREMLERVFNLCDKLQFPTEKQLSDLKTEIKSLLQSLKQEK